MNGVRLYWPVGLSAICLLVAIYLSVTDTAYLVRGCRVEDYPEAFFIFFVAPGALLAFVLGLRSVRSEPGRRKPQVIASAILSIACIAATVSVLAAPEGSICKSASHVLSANDVQKDVDALNANVQRSEREFEKAMNRPGPSDRQIASFQVEADKACVCTYRTGGKAKDACWAQYKTLTKPFRPQELTSACLYRTTVVDVFPGNKSVSINQCTAERQAAQLAKGTEARSNEGC